MNSYENISNTYVPCLDENRTESSILRVNVVGQEAVEREVPAYSLVDLPVKTSFSDDLTIDTKKTLTVSCKDSFEEFVIGFGRKDGKWSLFQEQTIGFSMTGTIDESENMDLWFTFGDRNIGADPAHEVDGDQDAYPTTAAMLNLVTKPQDGLVGMSFVGAGIGPGCGGRILFNSTALYFKGSANLYGTCYVGDYLEGTGQPAYDPALANYEVCMKVNGDVPEAAENGIDHCVEAGLIELNDSNEAIDPFTDFGLAQFSTNIDEASESVIYFRGWMAGHFMANSPILNNVQTLSLVYPSPGEAVEVDGLIFNGLAFSPDLTTNIENISFKQACNAATPVTAAFNRKFKIPFSMIFDPRFDAATKSTDPESEPPTEEEALANIIADFAIEGESEPYIEIPIKGSKGLNYRTSFTGKAKLNVDGTTQKELDISLPSSGDLNLKLENLKIGGVQFRTTSELQLEISGTVGLICSTNTATERTASASAGLPRLVWYADLSAGEEAAAE